MAVWEPILKSQPCIKKLEKPILTKDDIPYEAQLVFNAGVQKINGKYVMVYRNDYGSTREEFANKKLHGIAVGIAISDNGIDNWKVREMPFINYSWKGGVIKNELGKDDGVKDIMRLYDPRLMIIEGQLYLCLAMDTQHGLRGCIAKFHDDLETYEIISASVPDNRNMVLFPEKIGGYYVRLERPMPIYSRGKDRFDIWLSKSPDLKFWGESEFVLGVEHVPFANDKIGPAAPPIKTKHGWLTTFHAVDIADGRGQDEWCTYWSKRYTAGIMLLDLENPAKVIGMCKTPLIAPDMPYETDTGYRQNVTSP